MDTVEKINTIIKFMECCLAKGGNCTRCVFYTMPEHGHSGKCLGYKKIGPLLIGYMQDIRAEIEKRG